MKDEEFMLYLGSIIPRCRILLNTMQSTQISLFNEEKAMYLLEESVDLIKHLSMFANRLLELKKDETNE